MNSERFLTIGVPTYSRSTKLRETVNKIINQLSTDIVEQVEILISDNNSPDNTEEVVREIILNNPGTIIRYNKNSTNIGFDANVDRLFKLSNGRFVWTFSDDDSLTDSAIFDVIQALHLHDEVVFAFVDYSIRTKSDTLKSRNNTHQIIKVKGGDTLQAINFSNSLISSCIFRKSIWLQNNSLKYYGTAWIHIFMARDILLLGDALIIGAPMVIMMQGTLEESRGEKSNKNIHEIEFYMQAHISYLEYASSLLEHGHDLQTQRHAVRLGERDDIYQIVNYKLTTKHYSFIQIYHTWRALFKFRRKTIKFWLVFTPLLLLTNNISRGLHATYKVLK